MEQTPTGIRDFTIAESIERERMLDAMRTVFRRYGFYPAETGSMEFLSTLVKKSGEAVKEEIFKM